MAKGLQGVACLEEVSAVAIHIRTIVAENHLPHEHLRLRIHLFIERERVGMFQEHLGFRQLYGIGRHHSRRVRLLRTQHKRQQTANQSYEQPSEKPHSFTQPGYLKSQFRQPSLIRT